MSAPAGTATLPRLQTGAVDGALPWGPHGAPTVRSGAPAVLSNQPGPPFHLQVPPSQRLSCWHVEYPGAVQALPGPALRLGLHELTPFAVPTNPPPAPPPPSGVTVPGIVSPPSTTLIPPSLVMPPGVSST